MVLQDTSDTEQRVELCDHDTAFVYVRCLNGRDGFEGAPDDLFEGGVVGFEELDALTPRVWSERGVSWEDRGLFELSVALERYDKTIPGGFRGGLVERGDPLEKADKGVVDLLMDTRIGCCQGLVGLRFVAQQGLLRWNAISFSAKLQVR